MEKLLEIKRGDEIVLAICAGEVVLYPTRDADKQYAFDLLCNALAAVSRVIPPYSTLTTSQPLDRILEVAAPGWECRAFSPFFFPKERVDDKSLARCSRSYTSSELKIRK
jgi:hypothetical protein